MNMQAICGELLEQVDGALGCVVIDMQTGLTVAGEYRPGTPFNEAAVSLVSIASANMFSGKLIRQFEQTLARPSSSRFVREVHMTTNNANHFMAAIPGWEHGLLVLVTDTATSMGLGWMAVHQWIERFADVSSRARNEPSAVASAPAEAEPAAQAGIAANAPSEAPAKDAVVANAEGAPAQSAAFARGARMNLFAKRKPRRGQR